MSLPTSTAKPSPFRSVLLNWGPTVLFSMVLPFVTYSMLTGNGMHEVPALLISGAWPVAEQVLFFALHRRLDEFTILILIFMALTVISFAAFNSARMILIKDSALTGLMGLVFLASLLAPRPLTFYFGRKFGTDGSAAGIARWDGFWGDLSVFRRGQRIMTLVWGLALLAEALVRIPLVYVVPLDAMVAISNFLPFVVIAALIFWTISYGKRNATASKRQAGRLT